MLTFSKGQSQALGAPYTLNHNSLEGLPCLSACLYVCDLMLTPNTVDNYFLNSMSQFCQNGWEVFPIFSYADSIYMRS